MILEVANRGSLEVEVRGLYVAPKSGSRIDQTALEGDRSLPFVLEAGGSARFWIRAKTLASNFKEAGYDGNPRANIVVEDEFGNVHEKGFKFPVDKYLGLKDD